MNKREGYNDNLFEIKCLKCKSTNCSIIEHTLTYENDEEIGASWHIYCNDCHSWDI